MIQPSASTRLLGIIGCGIDYTLSPKIHNAFFKKAELDFVYLKFDLEENQLQSFLDIAWSVDALGFNVTKPYKSTVSRLLKSPHHGPINTIYRGASGWEASSTDAIGFFEGLNRIKKEISDFSEIIWIGFGGAAVSIQEALQKNGQEMKCHILVRSPDKIQQNHEFLLKKCSTTPEKICPEALQKLILSSSPQTLLVQATSAPNAGDDLSSLTPSLKGFRGTFVDLVYGKPSALYFEAIRQNISCIDGEPMLIEQARASQKIWFGKSMSYDDIQRQLR